MTLALFRWWWDAMLGLPRAQVVLSVVGIFVGAGLGYLAYRIGRQQKEMQEEQHAFFLEQRDNKPLLQLWVTGMFQTGPNTTKLSFSVRNDGKVAANGFAWEIVIPSEAESFVAFRTAEGHLTDYKNTIDFAKQTRINFFKKETHQGYLYAGDMVDVAWIYVSAARFAPFQIQWRLYTGHGTVPAAGHNVISVAPQLGGLLNVQPVLTIPAVTSG